MPNPSNIYKKVKPVFMAAAAAINLNEDGVYFKS